MLGLRRRAGFSSCCEHGLLFTAVTVVASLAVGHGLCDMRAPEALAVGSAAASLRSGAQTSQLGHRGLVVLWVGSSWAREHTLVSYILDDGLFATQPQGSLTSLFLWRKEKHDLLTRAPHVWVAEF